MPSMLEQAIIDAESLKEAAIKNAEQAIIEKYSQEVKTAVDLMLEQPEEDLMDDPMADPAVTTEAPEIVDEAPLAAAEGENTCPCPSGDDVVTINFDQLHTQMEEELDQNQVQVPL